MRTKIFLLVIDDDKNLCASIKRSLESTGKYVVHVATDGKEGLELALGLQPDVILLDMMMPQMTGPEVAYGLRNDPRTSAIPYIFLTGMLDKVGAASLIGALPGETYLAKPATTDEIVEAVGAVLRLDKGQERVALRA